MRRGRALCHSGSCSERALLHLPRCIWIHYTALQMPDASAQALPRKVSSSGASPMAGSHLVFTAPPPSSFPHHVFLLDGFFSKPQCVGIAYSKVLPCAHIIPSPGPYVHPPPAGGSCNAQGLQRRHTAGEWWSIATHSMHHGSMAQAPLHESAHTSHHITSADAAASSVLGAL